jgi:hypothetical protein
MNRTNFIQTGGWPLNSERLQELQTAFEIFQAFGSLAGNLTIISGCELAGSTIKKGVIYINGEPLEFREAAVTPSSTVIIIEEAVNRAFENGAIKQVHTIRYATFGTAETSWPWAVFSRLDPIVLLMERLGNAELAQNNTNYRLGVIEEKMGTIARGAEVNVQGDWNVTDANSDAFIKGKLAGDILRKGSKYIGDVSGNVQDTYVNFASVGTSDYTVLGSLRSSDNLGLANDPTVIWSTVSHGETQFVANFRETGNITQSLYFDYVLIRN